MSLNVVEVALQHSPSFFHPTALQRRRKTFYYLIYDPCMFQLESEAVGNAKQAGVIDRCQSFGHMCLHRSDHLVVASQRKGEYMLCWGALV